MRSHSLAFKVTLPLLVIVGSVAIIGTSIIAATLDQRFNADLEARAIELAAVISIAVEHANPAERSRIVQALGGEKDVRLLAVLAGKPRRIIASTRNQWQGNTLTELPAGVRTQLASDATGGSLPGTGRWYRSPLLIANYGSSGKALERGELLVHLDGSTRIEGAQSVQRTIVISILLMIGAIALASAWMVYRTIILRVQRLGRAIARRRAGHGDPPIVDPARDEIGLVVTQYNELVATIDEQAARVAHAHDQLVHSHAALEESNMELRQFAYVASHDLQTPLRSISGFAEFLRSDYGHELDQTAGEYLDRIIESSERMRDLIRDLLSYSSVDTRSSAFLAVDLNHLMDNVLVSLAADIDASNGRVAVGELPVVLGDEVQLHQLLQNLTSNALKYHATSSPHVEINASRCAGSWEIVVQDNGIGIDPKHHHRIFEIFKRLHTTRQYPGTGIGLAVCKRIAIRHDGDLFVESAVGKGSRFIVELPFTNPSSPSAHQELTDEPSIAASGEAG